ncbi:ABC transporter F family member 4-like [Mauremys reevesii]|uniref:ABC transporter F family member 4-like n=1 Tax=Mauremys reevesii TaxID=260615 RepID=UPI00193ED611|nr:ABC transporter F family member 4-like [Mauremys reevesii]
MERNKGPGLMHKLGFRKGSKRGEKVQVQEVEEGVQVTEEIPEIVDKGKDNKKSGKEKHNEKDELQTNADKGPGLKEKLRFWRGSKRGEKVQVQDVEEGVQVTEEIPEIVDSEKEKHNEEELQTLRSEVDEPQTKADKEIERKGTLTEKIRNQEQEKESETMKIESLKKLMEEVRKRKDIPEREKGKIEKEKGGVLQIKVLSIGGREEEEKMLIYQCWALEGRREELVSGQYFSKMGGDREMLDQASMFMKGEEGAARALSTDTDNPGTFYRALGTTSWYIYGRNQPGTILLLTYKLLTNKKELVKKVEVGDNPVNSDHEMDPEYLQLLSEMEPQL